MGDFLGLRAIFIIGLFLTPAWGADHLDHPYFEALKGEWVGEGEATDAQGVTTTIHEEWTAESEGDRFAVRGTRQWGEASQEYRWIFVFNVSTELFEAEYWQTGMDNDTIFEVSLSDTSAEMRTSFGGPGGELLVSNSLINKGIAGVVKFTDGAGIVLLEGNVKHEKREN